MSQWVAPTQCAVELWCAGVCCCAEVMSIFSDKPVPQGRCYMAGWSGVVQAYVCACEHDHKHVSTRLLPTRQETVLCASCGCPHHPCFLVTLGKQSLCAMRSVSPSVCQQSIQFPRVAPGETKLFPKDYKCKGCVTPNRGHSPNPDLRNPHTSTMTTQVYLII